MTHIQYLDGVSLPRIPATKKCHDCDAEIGELHSYICDMEDCPRCHKQLLSCDCELTLDQNGEDN